MTNKIMQDAYRRYCRSEVYYLCGENKNCAYGRCSDKKWKAWEYCKNLMDSLGGSDMRFIGAGTWVFSIGFVYEEDGEKMFMYITPSYNRACKIKELKGEAK